MGENLKQFSLTDEQWREYVFGFGEERTTYRIDNPMTLVLAKGGKIHRVVDDKGVVHCCPAVGEKGCILRWQVKEGCDYVAF